MPAPVAPITLTAAGLSPDRADRATFVARSIARDDFIKNTQIPQLQTAITNVYNNSLEAFNSGVSAAADAASSAINASQAASAATAIQWVSGATYVVGDARWSPITKISYRRLIAGAGATDPSADATNWGVIITPIAAGGAILSRFIKSNTTSVAFTKTAAGTASIKSGTYIDVAGTPLTFGAATAIVMPALTAGTDYAIYACTDGTVRADASFSAPSGYTTANSRKIGGFNYAPGGNAPAQAGGDTTPAINEYSFWDLKYKPSSPDPRGQMLVAGAFFADIYPLGVDHITNGTSKYNVTIADGSSPPKVPTQFGGNGTTAYTTLTQFEAAEVMAAYGKRLPTYAEFAALAYGTTEATSGGTDPVSTILRAAFTSKWGAMLASGNMWFWGADFGGGAAAAGWVANTVGRGSTYQLENAAIFGGSWGDSSNSGSRCSSWNNSPTFSSNGIGSRGVCDLLILE